MSNTVNVNIDSVLETVVSPTNANELNRKNIEALGTNIRLVDSDATNKLDLFCYVNCNKDDSELLQRCRGVVFCGDEIVLTSFPYTVEFTEDDHKEICETINLNECAIYDSYEGAIIKVFYYGDKWYISTNRKLDAFRSNWASKESFGLLFNKALMYEFETNKRLISNVSFNIDTDNAIEVLCDKVLDKSKKYMFLLLNSAENRIVCDEPEHPTVYHVGTFSEGNLSMEDDIYIAYPTKKSFYGFEEIYDYTINIDYTKLQGVIIFAKNNKQYKILNKDYKDLYNARGNEPSINFSYLKNRMDVKKNDMLRYLYPNSLKNFEEYENILYDTSKRIYDAYVRRYIKREFVTLPPEEYKIMSAAHEWYLLDRKINKITYNRIIEIMNEQEPTRLNRIIRNIKMDIKIELSGGEKKQRINPRLLPRNKSENSVLEIVKENQIEFQIEDNQVEVNFEGNVTYIG